MKKIKVLHIRDSCGIYGAERVIFNIAKHIDHEKFQFYLLALGDAQGFNHEFSHMAKKLGLNIETTVVKGRIDISAINRIRRYIFRIRPDIIHSHDFKSNFYSILASNNLKIKKIVSSHGSTRDSLRKKFYLFLDERIFYKFFDKIIAVSKNISKYLFSLKYPNSKIQIIQNGIDLSNFFLENSFGKNGIKKNSNPVFGIIGRLFPDKGYEYYLQAFSEVCKIYPNTTTLIIGDGPLESLIRKRINDLSLEKHVILCGFQKEMSTVYNKIDYIIIPSLREGLPYALLEAMLLKKPVLATSVGDIPLLIENDKTGFLIKPKDIEGLKTYMLKMIENPEYTKKLAQNAYQRVIENYSARGMVEETENLYYSVVNKTRI